MSANTIKYSLKVGRNPVHIEAEGFKALMIRAGFLAEIPNKCGNCQSDDIVLNGKKSAGYEFYSVLCRECKHELKCGQRKEDGGLWFKLEDGWVPPYKEGGGGKPKPGNGGRPNNDEDEEDDVPF